MHYRNRLQQDCLIEIPIEDYSYYSNLPPFISTSLC